jgi:hypothetical protein
MIYLYVTRLVYIRWEASKYISNIITNINAYIENYSPIVYYLWLIFLDLRNIIQIVYCLYYNFKYLLYYYMFFY